MITILGKSAGAISMITDNIQSFNSLHTKIRVVNNLRIKDDLPYKNDYFLWEESDSVKETDEDFIIGATYPKSKKKIFETLSIKKNKFINCIHSSSQISYTAKIERGVIINSLVSVAGHSTIGNFVTINRNSSIGHHSKIKDFVTIAPGATICGKVTIGKGAFIGAGAIIRDGVTIGEDCVIGAGSVVVKDVARKSVGFGNPFKVNE